MLVLQNTKEILLAILMIFTVSALIIPTTADPPDDDKEEKKEEEEDDKEEKKEEEEDDKEEKKEEEEEEESDEDDDDNEIQQGDSTDKHRFVAGGRSGSSIGNNTNIENVSKNTTTGQYPAELEAQPQGIITPTDFYERIMQHFEEAKLSPKDLIGPMEVAAKAQIMYDKLYEAYMEEVSPSNPSLMMINPEEVPTCETFYNNLTSFVKSEYQMEQIEPTKIIQKARLMYDSMYDVYKRCLSLKDSMNTTQVEQTPQKI